MGKTKKNIKPQKSSEHAGTIGEFRQQFYSLESHFRKVQAELEELQTLSTKLLDVGVAISSEINLYNLLTRIIEEAKGLLRAQNGTLYLVDHETGELYFHVVDVEQLKEIRMPINNKSISGYVALTGKPLNIRDVYEIPKSKPYTFNRSIDRKTGLRTRSMLTVPMLNHDGVVTGTVQLINKMEGNSAVPFSARDDRILMALASQAAVAIENAHLYKEIADLFESVVHFSASAIDERDPATAGHSRRVAMYALATAKALDKFDDDELRELEYAAWLHDVGKIGVREHILNKENKLYPRELDMLRERFEAARLSHKAAYVEKIASLAAKGAPAEKISKLEQQLDDKLKQLSEDMAFIEEVNRPGYTSDEKKKRIDRIARMSFVDSLGNRRRLLTGEEARALKVTRGNLTDAERKIMNAHVTSTYKVLRQIPFSQRLKRVPEIASCHHERLDGSGYPNGLKGKQVTLQSKILALVDVYDALTAQDRPYKPAMPVQKALGIIEEEVNAGRLDKDVYKAFLKHKVYELEDPGPQP